MQIAACAGLSICSHRSAEIMPTDACQFFYDCKGCGLRLKPLLSFRCLYTRPRPAKSGDRTLGAVPLAKVAESSDTKLKPDETAMAQSLTEFDQQTNSFVGRA